MFESNFSRAILLKADVAVTQHHVDKKKVLRLALKG